MPEDFGNRDPGVQEQSFTTVLPPVAMDYNVAKAKAHAIASELRRAARQSRQPAPIVLGGAGFRGRRGDRAFRRGLVASFVVVVLAPLAFASVYWGAIASDQYSTEVKFALRSGGSSTVDALIGAAGFSSSAQMQDTQILVDYIRSRGMVEALLKRLDFVGIYGRADVDRLSRLNANATMEEKEKYWRRRITVNVDSSSAIVTVDVRAFSADASLAVAQSVISQAEDLVNGLNARQKEDGLRYSQTELDRARANLQQSTEDMRDLRDKLGVLDGTAAAEAIGKIVSALRLELSQSETLLAVKNASAVGEAPQAQILRARIASLKRQISEYSGQIAGSSDSGNANMADMIKIMSDRQIDLNLARQRYTDATKAFEAARVDAETKKDYLVSIVAPLRAEQSTYPKRWIEWLLIVGPAVMLWSLGATLAFQIRDNMAK